MNGFDFFGALTLESIVLSVNKKNPCYEPLLITGKSIIIIILLVALLDQRIHNEFFRLSRQFHVNF